MKIKLKKCDGLDDWYTIVRAEHDGRAWSEQVGGNSYQWMMSERLTPDACIEGNSSEMVAIANAIKARGSESFKRCSVHFEDDGVHFCSPRNSSVDAVISIEDADEFAFKVLQLLHTENE